MTVHGGLTTKNIVTHFLKKIYAFLPAMHTIAEPIIIQKVSFYSVCTPQTNQSKILCFSRANDNKNVGLFQHSCLFLFSRKHKLAWTNLNRS